MSRFVRGPALKLVGGAGRIKVRYHFLKGEIHHFGGQKRERKEQENIQKAEGDLGLYGPRVVASLCSCKG